MSSINYEGLITKIKDVCLTEQSCGMCKQDKCLIGYCKRSLTTCFKDNNDFLDGGLDKLPLSDMKVYDDETVVDSLAFLLQQCKNCNLYHDEDCIINIVRSAFEVILLGDPQEYKGSTLMYLNDIKNVDAHTADRIFAAFQLAKKK